MSRSGCWTGIERSPKLHFVMNIKYVLLRTREEFGYQIRWIFGRKTNKRPLTLPPFFLGKLYCKLIDMVAYVQGAVMARYYEMHAHDFQRYGPFWGVGSTAVWNLCENSSDLVAWPVPQTCMTTRAFFKVCLVLIFLTTIVEKHVPRILKKFPLRSILMSILCQFHAQRPL